MTKKMRYFTLLGLLVLHPNLVTHASPLDAISGFIPEKIFGTNTQQIIFVALCSWIITELALRRWKKLIGKSTPLKENPVQFIQVLINDSLKELGIVTREELVETIEKIMKERHERLSSGLATELRRINLNQRNMMTKDEMAECVEAIMDENVMNKEQIKEYIVQTVKSLHDEQHIQNMVEEALNNRHPNMDKEEIKSIAYEVVMEVLKEVAAKHPACSFGQG